VNSNADVAGVSSIPNTCIVSLDQGSTGLDRPFPRLSGDPQWANPNYLRDEVSRTFLEKLFASVTQQYVTCDGRIVNPSAVQSAPKVTRLTLMNANTDLQMMTLTDGMTLDLSTLPTRSLNLRAETKPATVGSVRFGYDGNSNYRMEANAPYALAGDDSGNYRAWTPPAGTHRIQVIPFTGISGSGTPGISLSISVPVR
jgi:hypothetical protein